MLFLYLAMLAVGAEPDAGPAGERSAVAPAGESRVEFVVFEAGAPVRGLEIRSGERVLGRTDDVGSVFLTVPSGRFPIQGVRQGAPVLSLDLLTEPDEVVRILVVLRPDQPPALDIEASGTGVPLAGERLQEGAHTVEETPDLPPGALVGTILSAEDQSPVANARVFFSGMTIEVTTDEEGRFAAELPAGMLSVSVLHPTYETQTIDNIRVISEREVTLNMELTPAGIALEDYVVTAPYIEGTIADAIEAQRETSSVVEVLGAEQMAAAGDSDAAQALSRVSGLTVEQGKFVLVRGQPYRYSSTLWNGSPLPSPEPLVRVVPLDLFPTGVLSGIEVQKSYSADLPASFGSGLINLQTRGVPEEPFFQVGVSTGGNGIINFQGNDAASTSDLSDFLGASGGRLTYQGGKTDWLGFDDGTRGLPQVVQEANESFGDLNGLSKEERRDAGASFGNRYRPEVRRYQPDMGLSMSGGGRTRLPGDGTFGVLASGQWSDKWRNQARIQRSFALNDGIAVRRNDMMQNRTDRNVDLGGIVTLQAEWDEHTISASTFYAHQTQQRTELETGLLRRSDEGVLRDVLLSWLERSLVAQQGRGSHNFGPLTVEYRGLYAVADRDAPDRRNYSYIDFEPIDGVYTVFGDSGVKRNFSTVVDQVRSYGADLNLRVMDPKKRWLGLSAKAGIAGSNQQRASETRVYTWSPEDERGADLFEVNPEVLYNPANTGSEGTLDFRDLSRGRRDDYIGSSNVLGAYGLLDANLGGVVRLVGGLRYERSRLFVNTFQIEPERTPEEDLVDQVYAGGFRRCFESVEQDKEEDITLAKRQRSAECALYPSASATVFLSEEMQLRLAYGRSTSRPNLNELSDSRFVDPDSGEEFVGFVGLLPATIDGVDLRWEWYPSSTEAITAGAFVKEYTNPIERTFQQVGGTDAFPTFQNAASARVTGLEVGGRLNWNDFYFVTNFAYLNSEVVLASVGVDTNAIRPLDGQAKYTLNGQAGYSGERLDLTVALNMVGRRLHRAGVQGNADIYLQPIEGLNVVGAWTAWDTDRTTGRIRLKLENILDTKWTWHQGEERIDGESIPAIWREYRRGFTGGLSFDVGFH